MAQRDQAGAGNHPGYGERRTQPKGFWRLVRIPDPVDMPKFVELNEDRPPSEWLLAAKEALVGRGADCQVRLDDPSVSRHHAKVVRIFSGYFVEDLQSTNGVFVRIQEQHPLEPGDSLFMGRQLLRLDGFPDPQSLS